MVTDPADPPATDPVAIAAALVRCASVTPQDAGALALIARVLAGLGFRCERLTFAEPGTPDVENLFARLGTARPVLAFAGHSDVVPPGDPGHWRHAPFSGAIDGGALHGRGAVDMKGAIACFIAAIAREIEASGKPPGSVVVMITGDEEGPSINGMKKLLGWMRAENERFDHCLLGEPTNPDKLGDAIKIGRRGSLSGTIVVTGKQGHSAYPHLANNPVPALSRMVLALGEALDQGSEHFEPSTLEVVSVDVGNPAFNIIPAKARARFNVRFNDHHAPKGLAAWIRHRIDPIAAEAGVLVELVLEPTVSDVFLTQPGALVELVSEAVAAETGRTPALSTAGGTSDARFIKDHGPVVEFGLVGRTMHQVDEHADLDDLERLTRIYRRFIADYFVRFAA